MYGTRTAAVCANGSINHHYSTEPPRVHARVYVWVCVSLCVFVCVCVCVCVCECECLFVCLCLCAYVCVCECLFASVCDISSLLTVLDALYCHLNAFVRLFSTSAIKIAAHVHSMTCLVTAYSLTVLLPLRE